MAQNAAARVERLAGRSQEAYYPEEVARAEDALDRETAGLLHAATLDDADDGRAKADELVKRLAKLQSRAREAAEAYNEAAETMNVLVESFPSRIVAWLFGYNRVEYYKPEQAVEKS